MQEKIWDKQVYVYKNNTLVYSTNSNTGIRVSAFSGLECWNGALEWSEALGPVTTLGKVSMIKL